VNTERKGREGLDAAFAHHQADLGGENELDHSIFSQAANGSWAKCRKWKWISQRKGAGIAVREKRTRERGAGEKLGNHAGENEQTKQARRNLRQGAATVEKGNDQQKRKNQAYEEMSTTG